jgi:hypothetical protein
MKLRASLYESRITQLIQDEVLLVMKFNVPSAAEVLAQDVAEYKAKFVNGGSDTTYGEEKQVKVWRTVHGNGFFVTGENHPGGPKRFSIRQMVNENEFITLEYRIFASKDSAIRYIEKKYMAS